MTSDLTEARKLKTLLKIHQELEWRKCAADKKYFIRKYVWIQVQPKWDARGRTKFELFDYQEEAIDTWTNNRFVIILKARQLGYTTLAMADILWTLMFVPNAVCLVVSKSQDSANKNLGMSKFMYNFLPEWMKDRGPARTNNATYKMEFNSEDGSNSVVKSFAGTETSAAGETATRVVMDEGALMPDFSNTYRTIMPTTDAGGSITIISTARGAYNLFAQIYKQAKKGENQWVPLFQPWSASRLITEEDYMSKRREFAANPWEFYSEYPSNDEEAFRESGNPRFTNVPIDCDPVPFQGRLDEDSNGVIFIHDDEGPVYLHTLDPDPEMHYFIGADPAQGKGLDYSTAHVLCLDYDGVPNIVGFYRSNTVEETEWAQQMDLLGRFFTARYGPATLAVEDQGGNGKLPINELVRNLNYPMPYMYQPTGKYTYKRSAYLFSFPMTPDRRKMVIDKLAEYINNLNLDSPAIRGVHPMLMEELHQFIRIEMAGGRVKYAADHGCHDDLVMSLAIALWITLELADTVAPEVEYKEEKVFQLNTMYKIRAENIALAEELEKEAWESFSMGGNFDY